MRAAVLLITLTLLGGSARSAVFVREVAVTGAIHPVTSDILASAIQQAASSGDSLLIVRIDTPGGLLDAMRDCVAKIISSPVPVITYVAPQGARAASAGFFLLEAGDVAAMSRGTNAGAAHPVILGSQMDPVIKEKLENDSSASLRGITSQHDRNVELAESAVRQSKSFTAQEALDGRLIELIAPDEQSLLRQLDGRAVRRFDGTRIVLHTAGAIIRPYAPTPRQRVVSGISDPNIALILLAFGVLGIMVEFSSPGLIFPGVVGALCAVLGLSAIAVLPLNWLGVTLILLALALFALEVKFISHGVLSLGGAVALVFGATMLVDTPIPEMRIQLTTALSVALPLALVTSLLVTLAWRARQAKVVTGAEGMIGQWGVALEDLLPQGRILVHGENWLARAPGMVSRGSHVRVNGVAGLVLRVEAFAAGKESDR